MTTMTTTELRLQNARAYQAMHKLHERAMAENRDFTPEEQEQWNAWERETDLRIATANRAALLDEAGRTTFGNADPPIIGLDAATRKPVYALGPEHSFERLGDPSDAGHGPGLGALVQAVARDDMELAMGEGVNTAGGYLVPDQLSRQIVDKRP